MKNKKIYKLSVKKILNKYIYHLIILFFIVFGIVSGLILNQKDHKTDTQAQNCNACIVGRKKPCKLKRGDIIYFGTQICSDIRGCSRWTACSTYLSSIPTAITLAPSIIRPDFIKLQNDINSYFNKSRTSSSVPGTYQVYIKQISGNSTANQVVYNTKSEIVMLRGASLMHIPIVIAALETAKKENININTVNTDGYSIRDLCDLLISKHDNLTTLSMLKKLLNINNENIDTKLTNNLVSLLGNDSNGTISIKNLTISAQSMGKLLELIAKNKIDSLLKSNVVLWESGKDCTKIYSNNLSKYLCRLGAVYNEGKLSINGTVYKFVRNEAGIIETKNGYTFVIVLMGNYDGDAYYSQANSYKNDLLLYIQNRLINL